MNHPRNTTFYFFAIISLSCIFYHILFGIETIWPYYVDWLIVIGDWPAQYIGWEFYRKSPFTYPLGETLYYLYPYKSSVGFTDIPLFAFIFKPISLLTPDSPFQYHGIWFLFCFVLSFYLSLKFCDKYINSTKINNFLAGIFMAFSPILIFRLGHPGLCSHWLIIWFLLLFARLMNKDSDTKRILDQGFLCIFLSALIAPYFTLMCVVLFSFLFLYFLINKKISAILVLKYFVGIPFVIWGCWEMTGFFHYEINTSEITGHTFRTLSFNLNSFINPLNNSAILSPLPLNNHFQYEGFAYLGMGIIYLIIFSSIKFFLFKKGHNEDHDKLGIKLLWSACLLLLWFAITNKVTFGENVLMEFRTDKVLDDFFERFRSCGRFAWPIYYLLIAYIIKKTLAGITNTGWSTFILIIALIVQIFDSKQAVLNFKSTILDNPLFRSNPKDWESSLKNKKHLMLYPPFQYAYVHGGDYANLSLLAIKYGLTINTGTVARINQKLINYQVDTLVRSIHYGIFDTSQVWVTNDAESKQFSMSVENGIVFEKKIDGYHIFTVLKALPDTAKRFFSLNRLHTKFNSNIQENYFHAPIGRADHLMYGPHLYLRKGKYQVNFELMAKNYKTNEVIGSLAFGSNFTKSIHANMEIYGKDFNGLKENEYKTFSITFSSDQNLDNCEFLVWSTGKSDFYTRGISIKKLK